MNKVVFFVFLLLVSNINYLYAFADGDVISLSNQVNGSFENLIAQLTTEKVEATVIINEDVVLNSSVVIPDKIALEFKKGNTITLGQMNLTINSEIIAGVWKIFDVNSSGKIKGRPKVKSIIPHWWGPVGADWAPALQSVIDLVAEGAVTSPLSGDKWNYVFNIGYDVIDLMGEEYVLNTSIKIPGLIGGFTVGNGVLKCSESFPINNYIFETDTYVVNDNVHFKNLLIDGNFRGNGIKLGYTLQSSVKGCKFIRYNTNGLFITHNAGKTLEAFVFDSYFAKNPNQIENIFTNDVVAIYIDGATSDSHFENIVIYGGNETGIYSNGGNANIFSNIHIYGSQYGMKLKGNTIGNRIIGCYLDGCTLEITNPYSCIVTDNFFIYAGMDTTYVPLILKASTSYGIKTKGVNISKNTFQSNNCIIQGIGLDETEGSFYDAGITETFIGDNFSNITEGSVGFVKLKGTHFTYEHYLGGGDKKYISAHIDLSSKILFGIPRINGVSFTDYNGLGTSVPSVRVYGYTFTSVNLQFSVPINNIVRLTVQSSL